MSHSYTNLYYHLVFATKHRNPCLEANLRPQLFTCLGGLIQREGGIALAVGGIEDHVHLLVRLHQDSSVSEVLRVVKARSSRWVHASVPALASFAWQSGYGAFTVSASQVEPVRSYVLKQEEHHRHRSFPDEFRALLRKHGLPQPEELLWD